jgi:pimeloyl-ACP methyl ester carboxylesterase
MEKETATMRPTVIFVPGAFITDAAWWWGPVSALLAERDVAAAAVDYPSCGPVGPVGDLYDDADAVKAAVDAAEPGPVVLVGHSYGGMVITDAGAHPRVEHLVYMSAFVPDGTSAAEADFMKPEDLQAFELFEDGTAGEGGTKVPILRRLPDQSLVPEALTRLTHQGVMAAAQVPRHHAWKDTPSTFFVLTEDDDIAVENQRAHAKRTGSVVELPTNHYAHLERPDLVAAALLDITDGLMARHAGAAG